MISHGTGGVDGFLVRQCLSPSLGLLEVMCMMCFPQLFSGTFCNFEFFCGAKLDD